MNTSEYLQRYGVWLGRPSGVRPNYDCCAYEVHDTRRHAAPRQCQLHRGHGPGEAYCKHHANKTNTADSVTESRRPYGGVCGQA